MESHHRCLRRYIKTIESTFHCSESNVLEIKFNVSYHEINYNFSILQQDYSTAQFIGVTAPYRKKFEFGFASELPARSKSLTWHDVRDRVGKVIGAEIDNRLPENRMKEFLDYVEEGVCDRFMTTGAVLPRHGVLSFECGIVTEYNHVYNHEVESNGDCMVPAAESSFELLERCEDDIDEEEGGSCSICLDELCGGGGGGGGVALLRMPCLHVFHGGCIQEWLRSSHYCPICRYEMPVEEEDRS